MDGNSVIDRETMLQMSSKAVQIQIEIDNLLDENERLSKNDSSGFYPLNQEETKKKYEEKAQQIHNSLRQKYSLPRTFLIIAAIILTFIPPHGEVPPIGVLLTILGMRFIIPPVWELLSPIFKYFSIWYYIFKKKEKSKLSGFPIAIFITVLGVVGAYAVDFNSFCLAAFILLPIEVIIAYATPSFEKTKGKLFNSSEYASALKAAKKADLAELEAKKAQNKRIIEHNNKMISKLKTEKEDTAWIYSLWFGKAVDAECSNVPMLPDTYAETIKQMIDKLPYDREMSVEGHIDGAYQRFVTSKRECEHMKSKIMSDAEYILKNIH